MHDWSTNHFAAEEPHQLPTAGTRGHSLPYCLRVWYVVFCPWFALLSVLRGNCDTFQMENFSQNAVFQWGFHIG